MSAFGENPRRLQKLAPHVADEMLAERNRDRAPSLVIAGILLRQAVGNGIHLGLSNARLQPRSCYFGRFFLAGSGAEPPN